MSIHLKSGGNIQRSNVFNFYVEFVLCFERGALCTEHCILSPCLCDVREWCNKMDDLRYITQGILFDRRSYRSEFCIIQRWMKREKTNKMQQLDVYY